MCRRKLREHLVQQCAAAGVRFLAGEVSGVDAAASGASARVLCSSGAMVQTRWLSWLLSPHPLHTHVRQPLASLLYF